MEFFRKFARNIFGYDSVVYGFASWALSMGSIVYKEDWCTMRKMLRMAKQDSDSVAEFFQLRGLRFPIMLRPGSDDISAVVNNVIREEWGQFDEKLDPAVIIDAGAYIGDSAAYFLSRFPRSHVIALEPNQESYIMAAQNLAPYGERVSLIKSALWTDTTVVYFGGIQMGASIATQGDEVAAVSVSALMAQFGYSFVDILKMDIEGAELQIIPAGVGGWLHRVGMLLLETHGRDIENTLIPLLTSVGFECTRFRNAWYCKNRNPGNRLYS